MRMIPLDSLKLNTDFNYDPDTGEVTRKSDGYGGYTNNIGYKQIWWRGRVHSAHRIAWTLFHGKEPRGYIDHINGDRSDNRIINLRLSSSQGNNRNRRISSRNKSGCKGICWETSRGKWRASIVTDRKAVFAKRFDCIGKAVKAVRDARALAHGDFANHGDDIR